VNDDVVRAVRLWCGERRKGGRECRGWLGYVLDLDPPVLEGADLWEQGDRRDFFGGLVKLDPRSKSARIRETDCDTVWVYCRKHGRLPVRVGDLLQARARALELGRPVNLQIRREPQPTQ
jgi:hypothetical protein